ncbi:MAG: winged helix-turn-helix domain-containing protein [Blastocatellia bacterium]|nr:winged helix-turn-helix domain-containing protein [Blastocatellia bacterium]
MPNHHSLIQGYEFGAFHLNLGKRSLQRDGVEIPLFAKVFDVLVVLLQNRERTVGKEELMQAVWPDSFVEESNLSQNIFVLRKTLGEDPPNHRFIVTVPRRGYRFVAAVRELTAPRSKEKNPPPPALPTETMAPQPIRSLAVLPFGVLGPVLAGSDDEYLGVGLADALITRLTTLRRIWVRPTGAVLRYARAEVEVLAAGRALGVDVLLNGYLQKAPHRLRLTVQLVEVASETTLWAEKFDVAWTDIFSLQDMISEQVTRALLVKLEEVERERLMRRATENLEAYQLYLKGRFLTARWTADSLGKGFECFRQALALDPGFAQAYAGLSEAYFHAATFYLSPEAALPAMKEAATLALALDDSLAEAHTMLAAARMNLDWDWSGALISFRQAIRLNPGLAVAHQWYGWFCMVQGRHAESIHELGQALLLDPLSLSVNFFLGSAYYFARRYQEAAAQFRTVVELDANYWPAHWVTGASFLDPAAAPEALASLQRAMQLTDSPLMAAGLGRLYAITGNRPAAEEHLAALLHLSTERFVSFYYFAMIYLELNDHDQAFACLDRACRDRDENIPLLGVDPRFDRLRDDSRFRALLKQIGLPQLHPDAGVKQ